MDAHVVRTIKAQLESLAGTRELAVWMDPTALPEIDAEISRKNQEYDKVIRDTSLVADWGMY